MASIRPVAASIAAPRPLRVLPQPRLNPPERPEVRPIAPLSGERAPGVGETGAPGPTPVAKPSGVVAAGVATAQAPGRQGVGDPVDLSMVSDRTRVAIDHTVSVLHDRTGMSHDEIVESVAQMFKDLLVADGAADPMNAARALAERAMTELESAQGPPLLPEASQRANAVLDLEG